MTSKSLGKLTIDIVANTGSLTEGMNKAERAAQKMDAEYKQLKRSIDPAAVSQERFTKGAELLKRELDRGSISLEQYNADLEKLKVATNATAVTGFKNLGGAVQQAGYQVGDFAVQIASGQSAIVALTQQGAQLAGFFGPGGAVLGAVLAIGGAIGVYLTRAMGEGEDATKALSEAMKRLDDVASESDGIHTLTQRIRDLAKESEIAARGRLVSAIAAAEEAAKSAAKGIKDAFDDAIDTVGFSDLSDFFGARNFRKAVEGIQESLSLVGEEGHRAATGIFVALQTLNASPTIENFKALEETVAGVSTTLGENNPELQKLVANIAQYFDAARTAADRTEYLKKVLSDLSVATQDADGSIAQMVDKLNAQAKTLGLNSLQMIEYNRQLDLRVATEKNATKQQIDSINAAYDRIAAHEKMVLAERAAAEAAKKSKDAVAEQVKNLELQAATVGMSAEALTVLKLAMDGATASQLENAQSALDTIAAYQAQAEAIKKAEAEQKRISDQTEQISSELMSEEERIKESYERRREIILKNTRLTSEAQADLLKKLEERRDEELLKANGDFWERYLAAAEEKLTDLQDIAGSTIDNFSSRFGAAFERMVFDAETLSDAMKGMAESMTRSVVNAIGEMIAQWLAYKAVQLVTGKATQAAAATSQSANAQAMSIMAGLNAFASTAAIPVVGPALAPAAAAAAVAATEPMAAAVAALSLAGMAHDGIESIPETGTWLLQKGERVTTAETSAKLDRTLSDIQKNQAGGSKVTILNQTTGRIDRATERVMPDGERVILIEETIRAWNAMARDPNSTVSRTLGGVMNAQRNR